MESYQQEQLTLEDYINMDQMSAKDSLQFAVMSKQDVAESLNYIISFAAVFLVAPFTAWLGRKFQKDENADRFASITKDLEILRDSHAIIKELIKEIKVFCNHIHDDVNQMRSDDPNMTRPQIMINAHFYFNHYAKHLADYVKEVQIVDDVRNNWSKVSSRMLLEHLEIYRRLKTMLTSLVYKDRQLSDFADEHVKKMFVYMANYIMKNLWHYAKDEEMDEKDLEIYYENWRSKMMGIFSNYVDYGQTFKDQMEKDADWTMGNHGAGDGEVEFFIPKPITDEKKNDENKDDKREL